MDSAGDRFFIAGKVENTILLTVDTTARQTSDAIGALKPGRYLIQALTLTGTPSRCWVKLSPFVALAAADVLVAAAPAAGASASAAGSFPLDAAVALSISVQIRKNINDRLQAICVSGGAALLAITRMGD